MDSQILYLPRTNFPTPLVISTKPPRTSPARVKMPLTKLKAAMTTLWTMAYAVPKTDWMSSTMDMKKSLMAEVMAIFAVLDVGLSAVGCKSLGCFELSSSYM